MNQLDTLLAIASAALASVVEAEAENPLAQQHFALLRERNGFLAFESALLVRPVGGPLDVLAWNDETGWRADYGAYAEGLFFFAEDIFGGRSPSTPITSSPSTPRPASASGWPAVSRRGREGPG